MYFVKHHVWQTPDINCINLSKIGETVYYVLFIFL
jgi:hypothetical protein